MTPTQTYRILILTDGNGKVVSRQNFLAEDTFVSRNAAQRCCAVAQNWAETELGLKAYPFVCFLSFGDEKNERRLNRFLSSILETENPDTMTEFEVSANGTSFGNFMALNEQVARDLCAREAGYKDEDDMVTRLERPSELVAKAVCHE